MFNFLKKSKDKKVIEFCESILNSEIDLISINIKGNKLTAQWLGEELNNLFEINSNAITFTSKSSGTFSSSSSEDINSTLALLSTTLLNKFEAAKNEIHKFPNISNPQDGELKGQEWIKVTNLVLEQSYTKASKDKNLLVEANIYIGKRKETNEFEIRFQSYNLDYIYQFKNSGKIFVSVYDDKNQDRGSSKKASYMGEFFNNRPVILDQILKLISENIKSSEFKIFS